MDSKVSNSTVDINKHRANLNIVQDIDASALLLDTLNGFDDAEKMENIAVNEEEALSIAESFLPSLENIMVFSSYIKDRIQFILNMNGIANDPPFEIDLSRSGKKIQISGRRGVRKISRLLNSDEEVRDGMITLLSIAEQTYSLLMSLDDTTSDFTTRGKVFYLYGDGYLSLYKEEI